MLFKLSSSTSITAIKNRLTSQSLDTEINLTKLDVLDTFPKLKIAIAYLDENGEELGWPADLTRLETAKVVYHEMEGWNKPTTEARSYYDLPKQARDYVEYIERFVALKCTYIGTGPSRDAVIKRSL